MNRAGRREPEERDRWRGGAERFKMQAEEALAASFTGTSEVIADAIQAGWMGVRRRVAIWQSIGGWRDRRR